MKTSSRNRFCGHSYIEPVATKLSPINMLHIYDVKYSHRILVSVISSPKSNQLNKKLLRSTMQNIFKNQKKILFF